MEIELLAVKEAPSQISNTGYNRGVIIVDSKSVDNLINFGNFLGKECFLLKDITMLLCECPRISCKFMFREANQTAHVVAKYAISNANSTCQFYAESTWLTHILYSDLQLG